MPKAKSKTDRQVEEDDDKGRQWTNDETAVLLDLWSTASIKEMLDGPRKAAAHVIISERMKEMGMLRTSSSIRKRLKYLRKKYKAIRDHNKRSGASRKTWQWFDEMDAILGARPATEPSVVAEAGVGDEIQIDLVVEDESSDDADSDHDYDLATTSSASGRESVLSLISSASGRGTELAVEAEAELEGAVPGGAWEGVSFLVALAVSSSQF